MISWLKGQIIQSWNLSSKKGVVLNVGGVGYEVQILSKQLDFSDNNILKEYWIHQINRDECTNLYGFHEVNQRDLFRRIITVSGIGPQIGMALLEDFEVNQLVDAIDNNDLSLLIKSQGVGKRIAERLVLELKNKLEGFKDNKEKTYKKNQSEISNGLKKYIEEITSILNSLGYMDYEIKNSIKLLTTNQKENELLLNSLSSEAKTELMDKHLKEILIRLSQKST